MKRLLKVLGGIIKQMCGSRLPCIKNQNKLFADINHSIRNMEFQGNKLDCKNMRSDTRTFGMDFKKAMEQFEIEFNARL